MMLRSIRTIGVPTYNNQTLLGSLRHYSYFKSPLEGPPKIYTEVEKSYSEWKWVERLIPPETVPPPPTPPPSDQGGIKMYPSGWTAPNPPKDCPYLIRRTKNHMIPVYTEIWDRGELRETRIKRVEGNIWQLEKDVGKFLKSVYPKNKVISTYTQECSRYVGIKGDHSDLIKEWLVSKGF